MSKLINILAPSVGLDVKFSCVSCQFSAVLQLLIYFWSRDDCFQSAWCLIDFHTSVWKRRNMPHVQPRGLLILIITLLLFYVYVHSLQFLYCFISLHSCEYLHLHEFMLVCSLFFYFSATGGQRSRAHAQHSFCNPVYSNHIDVCNLKILLIGMASFSCWPWQTSQGQIHYTYEVRNRLI